MLYFNLTDNSIEVIQTSKGFIGGEKITASSKKDIPEGIVANGLVIDQEKLSAEILNLFNSAHPKVIKDKDVSLIVSDKQVFTQRFQVSPEEGQEESIIQKVKLMIPYDPSELENFYKELKLDNGQKEIFYTAMPKATVAHFGNFFKSIGLKVVFIAARSLCQFEIYKLDLTNNEKRIYLNLDKRNIEYFVYDTKSPIEVGDKKISLKSPDSDIKAITKKYSEDPKTAFSKIFIGGPGSLEINISEISKEVGFEAVKLGEVIDSYISLSKVNIDTGGFSKIFFVDCLGLFILSHSASPPNFIRDIEDFSKSLIPTPILSINKEKEENLTEVKKEEKLDEKKVTQKEELVEEIQEKPIIPEILEKKENTLSSILNSKIFYIIITAIITAIIMILIFSFSGNIGGGVPFLVSPSITPIPTVSPSLIPTPTIDSKLKRSDLKISVENGTDKSGFAKEIADFLEGKGYKNVLKANADRDNYEITVIKIKNSKKNYLPLVLSDLKEKSASPNIENLDEKDKNDIIMILGKK